MLTYGYSGGVLGNPWGNFWGKIFFSIFSGVWNFFFQSAVTQSWLVWHIWNQEIFYGVVHPLYFEKKKFWKFLKKFFKTVDFVFFTQPKYFYVSDWIFFKFFFKIIKGSIFLKSTSPGLVSTFLRVGSPDLVYTQMDSRNGLSTPENPQFDISQAFFASELSILSPGLFGLKWAALGPFLAWNLIDYI